MGGFLGIGKSSQEKALEEQKRLAAEEAEQSRRDAEIALAEKRAKKGVETANIQLGSTDEDEITGEEKSTKKKPSDVGVSKSLGLGGLGGGTKNTGVQV